MRIVIARGSHRAAPEDQIVEVPLTDGGQGTTMALTEARKGNLHVVTVPGPLGQPVTARLRHSLSGRC